MIEKLSDFPIIKKEYYCKGIGSFTIEWSLLSEDEGKEYEIIIKKLWDEIMSTPEGRGQLRKVLYKNPLNNGNSVNCISFNNTNSAFILMKKLPEEFLDKFSLTYKLIEKLNEYIEVDDGISIYQKKLKEEFKVEVATILGYSNNTIFDSHFEKITSVRVSSVG